MGLTITLENGTYSSSRKWDSYNNGTLTITLENGTLTITVENGTLKGMGLFLTITVENGTVIVT